MGVQTADGHFVISRITDDFVIAKGNTKSLFVLNMVSRENFDEYSQLLDSINDSAFMQFHIARNLWLRGSIVFADASTAFDIYVGYTSVFSSSGVGNTIEQHFTGTTSSTKSAFIYPTVFTVYSPYFRIYIKVDASSGTTITGVSLMLVSE